MICIYLCYDEASPSRSVDGRAYDDEEWLESWFGESKVGENHAYQFYKQIYKPKNKSADKILIKILPFQSMC